MRRGCEKRQKEDVSLVGGVGAVASSTEPPLIRDHFGRIETLVTFTGLHSRQHWYCVTRNNLERTCDACKKCRCLVVEKRMSNGYCNDKIIRIEQLENETMEKYTVNLWQLNYKRNSLVNEYVRKWNVKWFIYIEGKISNVVHGLEKVEVPAWLIT